MLHRRWSSNSDLDTHLQSLKVSLHVTRKNIVSASSTSKPTIGFSTLQWPVSVRLPGEDRYYRVMSSRWCWLWDNTQFRWKKVHDSEFRSLSLVTGVKTHENKHFWHTANHAGEDDVRFVVCICVRCSSLQVAATTFGVTPRIPSYASTFGTWPRQHDVSLVKSVCSWLLCTA